MKSFELLKELLLLQTAGAWESVDTALDLAIQIFSKDTGIEAQTIKNKIEIIKDKVWNGYTYTVDDWRKRQNQYGMALNSLTIE